MRRWVGRASVLGAALCVVACGGTETNDAGPPLDASGGGADSGPRDAGAISMDAGAEDSGVGDAGAVGDAGLVDAGADAGPDFAGPTFTPQRAAAGRRTSLGLSDANLVFTWGDNAEGQLGVDAESRPSPYTGIAYAPTPPSGLDAVELSAVAAGDAHALALDMAGNVWAWGSNDRGQIGNDAVGTDARAPVMVPGLSGVTHIAAGPNTSFAIDGTGALWGWGSNGARMLADGTTTDQGSPVAVDVSPLPAGVSFAVVGSGDNHTVGLADDGTVWVWGSGRNPLGLGGASRADMPMMVTELERIVSIAVGAGHTLALADDGTLYAWGNGGAGQLGLGDTASVDVPTEVDTSSLPNIATLRAGGDQSFAVLDDGALWAWGENNNGELAMAGGDVNVPTLVGTPVPIRDVAAGRTHGVALGTDGAMYTWGDNDRGQLGDGAGPEGESIRPTRGPSGALPVDVFPSDEDFSFVVMDNGEVWRMGRAVQASGGRVGGASPVYFEEAEGITVEIVASASDHTLLLDTSGGVWAMGSNSQGQLGIPSMTSSDTFLPVTFPGLAAGERIVWIDAVQVFSIALDSTGQVWAWGDNQFGRIGDGTLTDRDVPTRAGGPGMTQVAIGEDHVVGIDGSGFAWSWGLATSGRGGTTPAMSCSPVGGNGCNPTPVRVCDEGTDALMCVGLNQFLGPVDAVAAGGQGTILRRGGNVLYMGRNQHGQAGNGTWSGPGGVLTPQLVPDAGGAGPLSGVAAAGATRDALFALGTDGRLWGWGGNSFAVLGMEPATSPDTCTSSSRCRRRPAVIDSLSGITISSIHVGQNHLMVLDDTTGTVWSWGDNSNGELGHLARDNGMGVGTLSWVPRPITLLPR